MQTYAIKVFVEPANLLSSGFTGVAILIDRITSLYGFNFSTSLGLIVLNVPVAILCFKSIGKKFVISSFVPSFFNKLLLRICTFPPLFNDVILNVFFGGFVYGMSTVIALRGILHQLVPILLLYMFLIKWVNPSGSMFLFSMP